MPVFWDQDAVALERVASRAMDLNDAEKMRGQQRTALLGLYDSFLEAKAYR